MANLWVLVTLLAGLQAPQPVELGLAALVAQAPVIVRARVADPRMDVQNLPVADGRGRPFQRMRRHLDVVATLRGHAPEHLRVDEPHWAAQFAQWQQCQGDRSCQPAPQPRYRGQLSREPNPRQEVLVFLQKNAKGEWELAAEFALETADREAEVRALLQAARQGGRR